MYGPGNQLLSGAGRSVDQHRRLTRRDLAHDAEHAHDRRARPDYPVETTRSYWLILQARDDRTVTKSDASSAAIQVTAELENTSQCDSVDQFDRCRSQN